MYQRRRICYCLIKRLFDVCASVIAVVVFLIPWIIISVIIKLSSPGPVIYKARRVGKNGGVFVLYKFRSMRVDSGAIRATTLRGDSRIFPFGSFLRKSKLDETPQLINILKGEMSIIGPRPEDEVNAEELYKGKYKEILSVLPGLSSPASIYDYTHGELFESEETYKERFLPEKLDVELYYVRNQSLLYDLRTIIRTVSIITQILAGRKEFPKPIELEYLKNEG